MQLSVLYDHWEDYLEWMLAQKQNYLEWMLLADRAEDKAAGGRGRSLLQGRWMILETIQ